MVFSSAHPITPAAAWPWLRRMLAAALLAVGTLAATVVQAAPVAGMGTWERTLQARDINRDGTTDAFYDTVLNITWLADGNAAAGSGFDSYGGGRMNWADARAWASSLRVHGIGGWRLPTLVDNGNDGCTLFTFSGTDCGYQVQTISADGRTVYSELAHLFYVTLGNVGYCNESGDCTRGNSATAPDFMLVNTGDFRNLRSEPYWSGVPDPLLPSSEVWFFDNRRGQQAVGFQINDWYALAVRPGDVNAATPVPEPQGLALVLVALGALGASTRLRVQRRTG